MPAGRIELLTQFRTSTDGFLRDCCRIEWEDIDLAEATLSLHQLKTGSRIQIPIHPALLEHLEAHASQTGVYNDDYSSQGEE